MNATSDFIYQLAVQGVRKLVAYQPGKPIDELERELGLTDIVKLASNENPLGPSPVALHAIVDALPELARYPDGNGYNLKRALAEKHNVDIRQITLGNGSNEILELVARTFLTPDDEALFSQYAFAVYPIVTQAVGAKACVVPASNYGHDLQAMRQSVTDKTRVVFIANPNNPTGTLLPSDDLERFIGDLPKSCICVLDEAYYEFIDSHKRSNALNWLNLFPNLLVTRTFSKAYGLAGLRIGYAFSSREMADLLNRVRQPFNINSLALAAAEAALSDDNHLQRSVSVNQEGMKQLTEGFERMNLNWIPSSGNFVTVHLKRSGEEIYQSLLKKGVIVRPIGVYQMPEHLRISIGNRTENQKCLNALSEVLFDV
ncbi:MAG: histidinol-phosphate transaminase [Gammaproteobacteria bacterium]